MVTRPLFCEACSCATEHCVQDADDDDEVMALCTRCGRLQILPRGDETAPSLAQPPSPSVNSPTR